jgi:hypothetical protein
MFELAQTTHTELLLKLAELEENYMPGTLAPDLRLGTIASAMDRLKEKLKTHRFNDAEEEIAFFKTVLPDFLSLGIYYTERFELESNLFFSTPKFQQKQVDHLLRKMGSFYKVQLEFLKYCRAGRKDQDTYFFLRESPARQQYTDPLATIIDGSFCTLHSVKLATLLAYSRLSHDMDFILSGNHEALTDPKNNLTILEWTDPKTGLVELIYSLKEKGAFNNGHADIKTITQYFEKVFSVRLENVSRSFQEIMSRKKGETTYLGKLQTALDNKVTELSQKSRR